MQHIIRTTILVLTTQAFLQTTCAQKESGQSLREQLKNNTMPGWQYDRTATAAKTVVNNKEEKHDQSLITQIRKGTAANMRFMPVPAGTLQEAVNTQKAVTARTISLPSEQPLRTEIPALKTATVAPPMQQETNAGAANDKKE